MFDGGLEWNKKSKSCGETRILITQKEEIHSLCRARYVVDEWSSNQVKLERVI